MRAYLLLLSLFCASATACFAAAAKPATPTMTASDVPVISSITAGSKNVAVTSPKFSTMADTGKTVTATYSVYKVVAGQDCSATADNELAIAAGTSKDAKDGDATTLVLVSVTTANQRICVAENVTGGKKATLLSATVTVTSPDANWGRVRAYFVGGVLIANDSSAFSSAHQFYALNVEKSWRLPGCYLHTQVKGESANECVVDSKSDEAATLPAPGIVDLSGGKIIVSGSISITGGTITLGNPSTITNATATVSKAEQEQLGTDLIDLPPSQTFYITEGSVSGGTMTLIPGGIQLGPKAELSLATGKVDPPPPPVDPVPSPTKPKSSAKTQSKGAGFFHSPGLSTYFETRLTAIPVVSNGSNTTAPSTNSGTNTTTGTVVRANASTTAASNAATPASCSSSSGGSSNSGGSNTASQTACSFLTSQKTAQVGVGVYLPILFTRWDYNSTPNALFLAPLAKVGFNTITAPTTQTVVLPDNSGSGTQSFEQIYNYYVIGGRVGHMGLTHSTDEAPETYSYLDIGMGRYSNLESLICHAPGTTGGTVVGTGCAAYGGALLDAKVEDSRKRLYRVDIEGLLKIPNTLFYVGLNANIGQKAVGAGKIDPAFKAPDDLRFLFGTKFDIASLFQKLGVNLGN